MVRFFFLEKHLSSMVRKCPIAKMKPKKAVNYTEHVKFASSTLHFVLVSQKWTGFWTGDTQKWTGFFNKEKF
jgi:hypothetical protein